MIEEGRALFLQIAEGVEDSIIDGSLPEEAQAPSTNELAAFFRINPATAAKGVEHARRQGRALQAARHRHVRRARRARAACWPSAAPHSPTSTSSRCSPRPASSASAPTTSPPDPRPRAGRAAADIPPRKELHDDRRDRGERTSRSATARRSRSTTCRSRIEKDTIYGLLGRNGAGKTTVMSILTAQNFATSGDVRVFGEQPYENARVLARMCFVRESQKYPDDAMPHARVPRRRGCSSRTGARTLADRLIDEFQLPMKRRIKKLSRGQLSAVGVIIGLASRAEITFFDEPYLGLDAVARQIFYDRLLEDYTEHPRTVILSSHLIDEVANLIERVLVIDRGRIIMDEDDGCRARPCREHRRRRRSRRRLRRRPRGHPPREPRPGHRRSPCSERSPRPTASASAARGPRRRAGLAAAAHRPPHPARRAAQPRRRRSTAMTDDADSKRGAAMTPHRSTSSACS